MAGSSRTENSRRSTGVWVVCPTRRGDGTWAVSTPSPSRESLPARRSRPVRAVLSVHRQSHLSVLRQSHHGVRPRSLRRLSVHHQSRLRRGVLRRQSRLLLILLRVRAYPFPPFCRVCLLFCFSYDMIISYNHMIVNRLSQKNRVLGRFFASRHVPARGGRAWHGKMRYHQGTRKKRGDVDV